MLECLEIGPADQARASVIWMHGLGADASDFEPIVPLLNAPDVRFVFPNAPNRPVTINGGWVMRAWYDILTMDRVPERENATHIREATSEIEALIQRENARGVPTDKIVLAGFSQGAAMALFTGLRHAHTLAGIAVLSGYLVLETTLEHERHPANASTPCFFGHGAVDEVVKIDLGRAAYDAVEGQPREWHDYPIPHSVSGPEIAHMRDWLHRILTA
jgi:phospholipase/carboxylesterase